eukprot:scaffold58851_cov24-Tisochrysis_lutea.AAC.1
MGAVEAGASPLAPLPPPRSRRRPRGPSWPSCGSASGVARSWEGLEAGVLNESLNANAQHSAHAKRPGLRMTARPLRRGVSA